jgi:hypothetical protein
LEAGHLLLELLHDIDLVTDDLMCTFRLPTYFEHMVSDLLKPFVHAGHLGTRLAMACSFVQVR